MNPNFDQFGIRLKKVLKESNNSFAKKCDISEGSLRAYLAGTSLPGTKVLVTISELTGANIEWLATGNGPMMKEEASLPVPSQETSLINKPYTITNLEGKQVEYKPNPELCHIPILSVRAACGSGSLVDNEHIQAFFSALPSWFRRELNADPANLNIIIADGDSMTDTIKPDEMVIVDRSKIYRQTDGIWVFRYEDGVFLKRLQFLPGRKIEVTSDNPLYKTYTITPDDNFSLLGRVIATLPLRRL